MQQMIEASFTPAHPNSFKALLDEPFAGTFHHATSDGQAWLLEFLILDVVLMCIQIFIQVSQWHRNRTGDQIPIVNQT